MFTLRIDRSADAHRVTSCSQYTVSRASDGRTIVTLYDEVGPVDGRTPIGMVALESGDRCFVMNQAGSTVEVIKAGSRIAQMRSTG